jgi:hypothetical protein
MSGYYAAGGPPPPQGGYGQPRKSPSSFLRQHLLIHRAQLLNKAMASLLVSIRKRDERRHTSSRLTTFQHTHSKATVNLATAHHQASSSREATADLPKVLHPANSVAILSRATHHLRNITLDLARNIQASTAHHLQASTARLLDILPDSMVHRLQVLPPDSTSRQLLISKHLQDLQHRQALATFLAKSRTSTCLARQTSSAKP